MNHINSPLVRPEHIAKAVRYGGIAGVQRLADFVNAESDDPWDIFCGCQQQRVEALQGQQGWIDI